MLNSELFHFLYEDKTSCNAQLRLLRGLDLYFKCEYWSCHCPLKCRMFNLLFSFEPFSLKV